MNKENSAEKLAHAADSFILSVLKFVAVFALIAAAWTTYYLRHYEGLAVIDALDLAQAARHLADGDGLVTSFLRPGFPGLIPGTGPGPDLYNSPGYVAVLAGLFRWLGASSPLVPAASILGGLAACLAVFSLVWRRRGYGWALLGLSACGLSPGFLEASFSGLGIPLFSLIFLGFAVLLTASPGQGRSLGLAVLWGLLALGDFDFLLLLPLAAFGFWLLDRDLRGMLRFVITVLLILSPWLLRNLAVSGNPLGSLRWAEFFSWTGNLPGNRVFRDPSWTSSAGGMLDLLPKAARFFRLSCPYGMALAASPVAALFLLGLLRGSLRDRDDRVGLLLGMFLAAETLIVSLTDPNSVGMLLVFYPALILYVIASAAPRLRSCLLDRGSRVFLPVVGMIILPGLLGAYLGLPPARYFPPTYSPDTLDRLERGAVSDRVRTLVKEDETLLSDSPWAISWFSRRAAIWMPWDLEQVRELRETRLRLDFLHLTPLISRYPPDESPEEWREIYDTGRVPVWLGFEKGILLPGGETLLGNRVLERLDLE